MNKIRVNARYETHKVYGKVHSFDVTDAGQENTDQQAKGPSAVN
jgi:hypothetical protein